MADRKDLGAEPPPDMVTLEISLITFRAWNKGESELQELGARS